MTCVIDNRANRFPVVMRDLRNQQRIIRILLRIEAADVLLARVIPIIAVLGKVAPPGSVHDRGRLKLLRGF
jgi:hypothetical protein